MDTPQFTFIENSRLLHSQHSGALKHSFMSLRRCFSLWESKLVVTRSLGNPQQWRAVPWGTVVWRREGGMFYISSALPGGFWSAGEYEILILLNEKPILLPRQDCLMFYFSCIFYCFSWLWNPATFFPSFLSLSPFTLQSWALNWLPFWPLKEVLEKRAMMD